MKRNQNRETHYEKTALRLMRYVAGTFRLQFTVVFMAIVGSALAGAAGPLFLMVLIDDFITPLLGAQNPDFSGLFRAVLSLGGLYYVGVFCTYRYNRLMVNIG